VTIAGMSTVAAGPNGPLATAAPAGTDPASPPALPVPSDPSQFYPVAGQKRRDLGTVRPSY